MGQLFRRHWLPAFMSEEIAEPDGPPIRVKLLGESLVAFRDSLGRVGVMDEHCPHRRASLVLGRNEECGLRCIYHGWKIDVEGRIVEMPSEPAGARIMEKVRHRAYPVRESGGFIWVYLGPREEMPEFMPPPWADANFAIAKMHQASNWAQIVEGVIDSSHTSSLHSSNIRPGGKGERTDGSLATGLDRPTTDKAPRIQVQMTDYGFRYAAIRRPTEHADINDYVRVTVFIAPFLSLIPPTALYASAHMHIPTDDHNTMVYVTAFSDKNQIDQDQWRARSGARVGVELDKEYRSVRNLANNYLQDRTLMKQGHFSGIHGVSTEDQAVTETMGPITDRTKEILGAGDTAIVRFRRMMLQAAEAVAAGGPALGIGTSVPRKEIKAHEGMVRKGADWRTLAVSEREIATFRSAAAHDQDAQAAAT